MTELINQALLDEASTIVSERGIVSLSMLQRLMRIGYHDAVVLIEQLEDLGVVSAPDTVGRRTVLDMQQPLKDVR